MAIDSTPLINKLRATLGRMEVALGTIIDAITWTDEIGRVSWSNATFDQLIGQSRFQVLGANLFDLLPLIQQGQAVSAQDHPVSRALRHKLSFTDIYEFQGIEKRLFLEISCSYVQLNVSEASAVLAIRDVTARQQAEEELKQYREHLRELVEERTADLVAANNQLKQTQAQLIQTEKMSSLGQLVAGIAHEINNPVNFIHGNLAHVSKYAEDLLHLVRLYQQSCPNPGSAVLAQAEDMDLEFICEDLPKILNSMRVGTNRIRQIVLLLRNFSRLDEAEKKPVNLHEGIDSTLMILQSRIKATTDRPGIDIVKVYGDLPLVECYVGQINQVFMNILSNAIDSLEEHYSKMFANGSDPQSLKITICTEVVDTNWVAIHFTDNGLGMKEDIAQRIFDPFFTTKPIGKGTGMGMSISYQIVTEKHGGILQCVSSPGKGAEFIIKIPVAGI